MDISQAWASHYGYGLPGQQSAALQYLKQTQPQAALTPFAISTTPRGGYTLDNPNQFSGTPVLASKGAFAADPKARALFGDMVDTSGMLPSQALQQQAPPGLPGPGNYLAAWQTADPAQDINYLKNSLVSNQQQLLQTLGPSMREAVFAASPELRNLATYYQNVYNDPFEGRGGQYQDYIRQAMAARGFDYRAGEGPGLQEASMMASLASQRRAQLAPAMQDFGTKMLGLQGMGEVDTGTGTLGSLALQYRQYASEQQSAQQAAALQLAMYNDSVQMQREQAARDYDMALKGWRLNLLTTVQPQIDATKARQITNAHTDPARGGI